jgi:hypothetical protein
MDYREAIAKVKEGLCPGIPSRLACRPKCWSSWENPRIYPTMGYLALLPLNGPHEWYLMGVTNEPMLAEFSPDVWMELTVGEWEVIPFPPTKEDRKCVCTDKFRGECCGGVQTVGGTYDNYVRR